MENPPATLLRRRTLLTGWIPYLEIVNPVDCLSAFFVPTTVLHLDVAHCAPYFWAAGLDCASLLPCLAGPLPPPSVNGLCLASFWSAADAPFLLEGTTLTLVCWDRGLALGGDAGCLWDIVWLNETLIFLRYVCNV